ncbi:hypothetical protein ACFE04_009333 [Oxalis oulophora]
MNPNPNIRWISQSSSTSNTNYDAAAVPALTSIEMEAIADRTIQRYATKALKRNGKGVSIVCFRNDLRVLDNEALVKAWVSSDIVLPVCCVDPRLFGTTYHFGLPKTGALRTQFLIECLADLKKSLMKKGLNLLIKEGKPEDILPSLAKSFQAHTVYAQKETCSEEVNAEKSVSKGLRQVILQSTSTGSKLQFVWGTTMYHIDDLPFNTSSLPDIYTQFRKRLALTIGETFFHLISLDSNHMRQAHCPLFYLKKIHYVFNETHMCKESLTMKILIVLLLVSSSYQDLLKVYKETRNVMLGPDYSTKFSPWLASGSISPRYIYEEVMRYEKERVANDSTYWVRLSILVAYARMLIHNLLTFKSMSQGGPRDVQLKWSQNQKLFESWRDGSTGYPLIDANMKELSMTGFMSNRGRQIVCSFLVRDMGLDWRMGAEWFETCLLDYDPCSNYGNWAYGAGVGNDPREGRYFSIPKQVPHTAELSGGIPIGPVILYKGVSLQSHYAIQREHRLQPLTNRWIGHAVDLVSLWAIKEQIGTQ